MKNTLATLAQRTLIALLLVDLAGASSTKTPPAEHTYRAIPALEQKLQRTWSRKDYLDAHRQSALLVEAKEKLAKSQQRKTPLGRFHFMALATAAALYRETGDAGYFDVLRQSLLHETAYPSSDIQFGLCRITSCYEAVRDRLEKKDRDPIDSMIAAHADRCLNMESGTEMNRGIMNTLGLIYACKLLPQHPHRADWERGWKRNWQQGLLRVHDNNEDAINYNQLWLYYMMLVVREAEPNPEAFYRQPWVKDIFERHLQVRTPLGNEPETIYGALREKGLSIAPMEWAAQIYRDGRFRWAAQRTLNLLRSQPGKESFMPDEPAFLYVDDTVPPVQPEAASYYSHRRYDREYPNKFVLRSGYGPEATALVMNLFHGGGHGLPDGSAIYCLMDRYGLLLSGGHRYANAEENNNVMLLRRKQDPFPFGEFGRPDEWQRMHVDLRAANTAVGNLNIEWSSVNRIGLRHEVIGTETGSIQVKGVAVLGKSGTKILLDREISFPASQQWMNFPLEYPLNLEADDALEVVWKRSREVKPESVTLVANSDKPEGSARWYPFLTHNWRSSRVRFFADFQKAQVASVAVDLFDYAGDDHTQYRDILMLPNELIWVRDTARLGGKDDLQAGPLWHVNKVETHGANWFQTSTHTTANFTDSEMEAGEPRNLLIVFALHDGMVAQDHHEPQTKSGRPHCVYQKWQGAAGPGRRVAFDSFLIPNDGRIDPAQVAAQIKVLHEDDQAAVIRYRDWLLVDNPNGDTVRTGTLETNYRLAVIQLDPQGQPLRASGLNGTVCRYRGQSLKELPGNELR